MGHTDERGVNYNRITCRDRFGLLTYCICIMRPNLYNGRITYHLALVSNIKKAMCYIL